jgi:hypothetical protein
MYLIGLNKMMALDEKPNDVDDLHADAMHVAA